MIIREKEGIWKANKENYDIEGLRINHIWQLAADLVNFYSYINDFIHNLIGTNQNSPLKVIYIPLRAVYYKTVYKTLLS